MAKLLRKNYQVPKFIVTCVINTEGIDVNGDVPPIPCINGQELTINNNYEARHSNISEHLEILDGDKVVAILPKNWFIF